MHELRRSTGNQNRYVIREWEWEEVEIAGLTYIGQTRLTDEEIECKGASLRE